MANAQEIQDRFELSLHYPKSIDPNQSLSDLFGYQYFHKKSYSDDHQITFEISMHRPKLSFERDILSVFPDLRGIKTDDLYVITVFQRCYYDLISKSPQSDWERNLLCAYFLQLGKDFVASCLKYGCLWADFTDPVDGLPVMTSHGSSIYSDVDGVVRLLKYRTIQVGICSVIDHPRWRTRNYPGTLFVVGDLRNVKKAFMEIRSRIDS